MPHPGPHGHRHDDRTALGLLLLAARRLPGAGENRMTPRLVGDEFHRNEEEVATIYGISMSYAGAGAAWLSLRHWEWSARTSMTRQSAILPHGHCTNMRSRSRMRACKRATLLPLSQSGVHALV